MKGWREEKCKSIIATDEDRYTQIGREFVMADGRYFSTIRLLAEYEVWCNAGAIEAAQQLGGDELLRVFPFGLKTIHQTLFHTVEVFQLWGGCVGPVIAKPAMVEYDAGMPLEEMRDGMVRFRRAFLAAVDASHAAGIAGSGAAAGAGVSSGDAWDASSNAGDHDVSPAGEGAAV